MRRALSRHLRGYTPDTLKNFVQRWLSEDGSQCISRVLLRETADSILIFHAFGKKLQKTANHEIAVAQKRLKEMLDEER